MKPRRREHAFSDARERRRGSGAGAAAEAVARRPFLLGIAGGTGSGKTTLARDLLRQFEGSACLIELDCYYRDRSDLTLQQRQLLNYDEPSAIDHDLLCQHLGVLLGGAPIARPCYSFAEHARLPRVENVAPAPLVILEGLFALAHESVRQLLDFKVFVDAPADVRFIRRLRRDCLERGRTMESVIAQYLATVRPMHLAHIEPTRDFADLVVSGQELERESAASVLRLLEKKMVR